jgi:excisionase family DNA binding protein
MGEREPRTWRVKDIVRILNITRETTLKLLATGQLKGFKAGRDWRVTDDALREFMKQTPEPRPSEETSEEPPTADNPLAIIDAELDPGICDKMTLMEKIENLVQPTSSPRPIEA